MDTEAAASPTESDPVTAAIAALTAAARRRRTTGAGTPGEHTETHDFGAIACQVITAVAANVGGVGALLSDRPSSWEASCIRQIVLGTAGDDERDLLRHRTEPLRLLVDVEGTLRDFGIYELYENAAEELARRIEGARDALIRTAATPAAQARLADIEAVLAEWGPVIQGDARRARAVHLRDEWVSIVQSVTGRAENAGDPLYAALAAAEAAEHQLDVLWDQDQAVYREAYEAALRQVLAEQGIAGELEFIDPFTDEAAAFAAELLSPFWTEVDQLIHARVQTVVPLPMTGKAPDWSDGMPADSLRRAGLTYLERATAS